MKMSKFLKPGDGGGKTPFLNDRDGKYKLEVEKVVLIKSKKEEGREYLKFDMIVQDATAAYVSAEFLRPGETAAPTPHSKGTQVTTMLEPDNDYFVDEFTSLFAAITGVSRESLVEKQIAFIDAQTAAAKAKGIDLEDDPTALSKIVKASPIYKAFQAAASPENPLAGQEFVSESYRKRSKKSGKVLILNNYRPYVESDVTAAKTPEAVIEEDEEEVIIAPPKKKSKVVSEEAPF